MRPGPGGRGEPAPASHQIRQRLCARHAVAVGTMPQLRRGRRRLCARRGSRRGHPETARPGTPRRRSHLWRHQGVRSQSRRAHQWLHRAESGGAGGRRQPGPAPGGHRSAHHRLCRGPWHGHQAGRSHRGRWTDPGLHVGPGRGRVRLVRTRIGQVQHRPPGGRRRDRRPDQDPAPVPAPDTGSDPERRTSEPGHRLLAHALRLAARTAGLGRARGPTAPGGAQLLRGRRDECPSDRRGVPDGAAERPELGHDDRIRVADPAVGAR